MRILVAGGAGFIGSHLVDELMERGYEVRVADDFSKGRRENLIQHEGKKGFEVRQTDFLLPEECRRAVEGVEVVFLLASRIGGIGYFHKYPADIIRDNARITLNLLDASLEEGVRRVLFVSSSMVFERATVFPTPENALESCPVPLTAYGFSKLMGEWFCKAYGEQHGLRYTILRPFNAVGPRERPEEEPGLSHVIPDLTKKILSGQYPLELYGDGSQTRCFTHVRDIVRGFRMAMESGRAEGEDFNLGNPEETRIDRLAERLWEVCGRREPFRFVSLPPFKHDVGRRVPDITKARRLLGWEPRIPLEQALREYVEWYRTAGG